MKLLKSTLGALALAGLVAAQSAIAAPAGAPKRLGSPTAQEEALTGAGVWIAVSLIVALAVAEITGITDIFEDTAASP